MVALWVPNYSHADCDRLVWSGHPAAADGDGATVVRPGQYGRWMPVPTPGWPAAKAAIQIAIDTGRRPEDTSACR